LPHLKTSEYNVPTLQHPEIYLDISRWENPQSDCQNLVDRQRRHSSVLDVQSFRAADCDIDHYLVVAKNKQRSHRFHLERFNLKKLNEVGGKKQFHVEV
jgi:hypothetical protein